jgi:hypothetical protein
LSTPRVLRERPPGAVSRATFRGSSFRCADADLEEVIIPVENSGAAILLIVGGDDQGYGPAYHEVTARHYNRHRPHRSRGLRPPRPDHPIPDRATERINRRPVLGGLINQYQQAA